MMEQILLPDEVFENLNENAVETSERHDIVLGIDERFKEEISQDSKEQQLTLKSNNMRANQPSALMKRLKELGTYLFQDIGSVIKFADSKVEVRSKIRRFLNGLTKGAIRTYQGVKTVIQHHATMEKIFKIVLVISAFYLIVKKVLDGIFGEANENTGDGVINTVASLFVSIGSGIWDAIVFGKNIVVKTFEVGKDLLFTVGDIVLNNTQGLGDKVKDYFLGADTKKVNQDNNVAYNTIVQQNRQGGYVGSLMTKNYNKDIDDERIYKQQILEEFASVDGVVKKMMSRYKVSTSTSVDDGTIHSFISFVDNINGTPLDYTTTNGIQKAVKEVSKNLRDSIVKGIDNEAISNELQNLSDEQFFEKAQSALEDLRMGKQLDIQQENLVRALLKKKNIDLSKDKKDVDAIVDELRGIQKQLHASSKLKHTTEQEGEKTTETPWADSVINATNEANAVLKDKVDKVEKQLYEAYDDTKQLSDTFISKHKDVINLKEQFFSSNGNLAKAFSTIISSLQENIPENPFPENSISSTELTEVSTEEKSELITDVTINHIPATDYENALIMLYQRATMIEDYMIKTRASVRKLYDAVRES